MPRNKAEQLKPTLDFLAGRPAVTMTREVYQHDHIAADNPGVCAGMVSYWMDAIREGRVIDKFHSLSAKDFVSVCAGAHLQFQQERREAMERLSEGNRRLAQYKAAQSADPRPDKAEIYRNAVAQTSAYLEALGEHVEDQFGKKYDYAKFCGETRGGAYPPGLYMVGAGAHAVGVYVPATGEHAYFLDPNVGEMVLPRAELNQFVLDYLSEAQKLTATSDLTFLPTPLSVPDDRPQSANTSNNDSNTRPAGAAPPIKVGAEPSGGPATGPA